MSGKLNHESCFQERSFHDYTISKPKLLVPCHTETKKGCRYCYHTTGGLGPSIHRECKPPQPPPTPPFKTNSESESLVENKRPYSDFPKKETERNYWKAKLVSVEPAKNYTNGHGRIALEIYSESESESEKQAKTKSSTERKESDGDGKISIASCDMGDAESGSKITLSEKQKNLTEERNGGELVCNEEVLHEFECRIKELEQIRDRNHLSDNSECESLRTISKKILSVSDHTSKDRRTATIETLDESNSVEDNCIWNEKFAEVSKRLGSLEQSIFQPPKGVDYQKINNDIKNELTAIKMRLKNLEHTHSNNAPNKKRSLQSRRSEESKTSKTSSNENALTDNENLVANRSNDSNSSADGNASGGVIKMKSSSNKNSIDDTQPKVSNGSTQYDCDYLEKSSPEVAEESYLRAAETIVIRNSDRWSFDLDAQRNRATVKERSNWTRCTKKKTRGFESIVYHIYRFLKNKISRHGDEVCGNEQYGDGDMRNCGDLSACSVYAENPNSKKARRNATQMLYRSTFSSKSSFSDFTLKQPQSVNEEKNLSNKRQPHPHGCGDNVNNCCSIGVDTRQLTKTCRDAKYYHAPHVLPVFQSGEALHKSVQCSPGDNKADSDDESQVSEENLNFLRTKNGKVEVIDAENQLRIPILFEELCQDVGHHESDVSMKFVVVLPEDDYHAEMKEQDEAGTLKKLMRKISLIKTNKPKRKKQPNNFSGETVNCGKEETIFFELQEPTCSKVFHPDYVLRQKNNPIVYAVTTSSRRSRALKKIGKSKKKEPTPPEPPAPRFAKPVRQQVSCGLPGKRGCPQPSICPKHNQSESPAVAVDVDPNCPTAPACRYKPPEPPFCGRPKAYECFPPGTSAALRGMGNGGVQQTTTEIRFHQAGRPLPKSAKSKSKHASHKRKPKEWPLKPPEPPSPVLRVKHAVNNPLPPTNPTIIYVPAESCDTDTCTCPETPCPVKEEKPACTCKHEEIPRSKFRDTLSCFENNMRRMYDDMCGNIDVVEGEKRPMQECCKICKDVAYYITDKVKKVPALLGKQNKKSWCPKRRAQSSKSPPAQPSSKKTKQPPVSQVPATPTTPNTPKGSKTKPPKPPKPPKRPKTPKVRKKK